MIVKNELTLPEPISGKEIEDFVKKKSLRSGGIQIHDLEYQNSFRPDRMYRIIVIQGTEARPVRDRANILQNKFGGEIH
jgi:hypothetical protein